MLPKMAFSVNSLSTDFIDLIHKDASLKGFFRINIHKSFWETAEKGFFEVFNRPGCKFFFSLFTSIIRQ
jgi:hypothetical protein